MGSEMDYAPPLSWKDRFYVVLTFIGFGLLVYGTVNAVYWFLPPKPEPTDQPDEVIRIQIEHIIIDGRSKSDDRF